MRRASLHGAMHLAMRFGAIGAMSLFWLASLQSGMILASMVTEQYERGMVITQADLLEPGTLALLGLGLAGLAASRRRKQ